MPRSRFLHFGPNSGFWRLNTTEETARRREFNIWALIETLVAIFICLLVAVTLQTFGQLVASIAFVPLFFLRSNASVRLGASAFQRGFFPPRWPDEDALKQKLKRKLILIWWLVGGLIGLVGTRAFFHFLSNFRMLDAGSNIADALHGFLSVVILLVIIEAIAGALAATIVGAPIAIASAAAAAVGLAAAATLVESCLLVSDLRSQAWALGAGTASVLLCGAFLVVVTIDGPKKIASLIVASAITASPGSRRGEGRAELDRIAARWPSNFFVGLVFTSVMFCISMWLCSLLVRFFASATYFMRGFSEMPSNIVRLSLCMSPFHTPEMLPGLPDGHNYSFQKITDVGIRELRSDQIQFRMAALPFLVFGFIWRLTGWAYRFFLKSTLWFWWPLLVLGGYSNYYRDVEDLKNNVLTTEISRVRRIASYCTLLIFFFGNYFLPFVRNHFSDTPILPTVALLTFFDFRSLTALLLLSSAILIIGIFWWANSIAVNSTRVGYDAKGKLRKLNRVAKLQRALGLVVLFLSVTYLLLYANSLRWRWPISDWLSGWLQWLYGDYAKILLL